MPAQLLPVAFFNSRVRGSEQWALTTLLTWITTTRPHIDVETGTALGGPLGVRCIVFAISRILQNITIVQGDANIPDQIGWLTRGDNSTWSPSLALHQVLACIESLCEQLQVSCAVLTTTFEVRAQAWEEEVERRWQAWHNDKDMLTTANITRGINATSGVPHNIEALGAIRRRIQRRVIELPEIDETAEASTLMMASDDSGLKDTLLELGRLHLSTPNVSVRFQKQRTNADRRGKEPNIGDTKQFLGRRAGDPA
jgi:hypothetical protein